MLQTSRRTFTPPTDIIELKDRLVVLVEIAGMRIDDFKVILQDAKHLIIMGQRQRPTFESPAYYQVEISVGHFRIDVQLPYAIDRERVEAHYADGFLRIDLPRRIQHIQIQDSTNGN
ncbi:MAG: Hsp20/alpha crystallin family protein [Phototrophicales bacterium]|nr:MAG: Hsp20/alpha crystallin family protein [Phototrophicales bacterium]